eukprot:CAMPEP_0203860282 /NCGR_PEP_ID=MMETSP0359-20131031/12338_1 /ASSEMBLY_ACC=CAM_ASM_000338 /TAXON_ID=268821 /ORGANISM="Scrippsiella Hangoei, Strain SHTV-5" /LENGTH=41 /DNA_ID= /DNA_START= /DNA_END= /DNA_ORIENTATION=
MPDDHAKNSINPAMRQQEAAPHTPKHCSFGRAQRDGFPISW